MHTEAGQLLGKGDEEGLLHGTGVDLMPSRSIPTPILCPGVLRVLFSHPCPINDSLPHPTLPIGEASSLHLRLLPFHDFSSKIIFQLMISISFPKCLRPQL